jgi:hypothetical protein
MAANLILPSAYSRIFVALEEFDVKWHDHGNSEEQERLYLCLMINSIASRYPD